MDGGAQRMIRVEGLAIALPGLMLISPSLPIPLLTQGLIWIVILGDAPLVGILDDFKIN